MDQNSIIYVLSEIATSYLTLDTMFSLRLVCKSLAERMFKNIAILRYNNSDDIGYIQFGNIVDYMNYVPRFIYHYMLQGDIDLTVIKPKTNLIRYIIDNWDNFDDVNPYIELFSADCVAGRNNIYHFDNYISSNIWKLISNQETDSERVLYYQCQNIDSIPTSPFDQLVDTFMQLQKSAIYNRPRSNVNLILFHKSSNTTYGCYYDGVLCQVDDDSEGENMIRKKYKHIIKNLEQARIVYALSELRRHLDAFKIYLFESEPPWFVCQKNDLVVV